MIICLLFNATWQLYKIMWISSWSGHGMGREIMMRWRVKRWNVVDKISSLKLSLLQLHIRGALSFSSSASSTRVELSKNVCFYVLYLKILIIYHTKDLWWFFKSLDTFLLQMLQKLLLFLWQQQLKLCCAGREIYQTSIFRFCDSNLVEGIFHLTTKMSLRQIHVYLGMK